MPAPSLHSRYPIPDTRYFSLLLVFLLSLIFFSLLQPWGGFRDPDGFYHAKLADLILHGPSATTVEALHPTGSSTANLFFLQNFRWLDLTLLHEHFVDQHLLYHIALIPFIKIFGPLLGTQIAAIFFSALFVTLLYAILRSLRVSRPTLWTTLAVISMPLSFRLSLVKATPFALGAFLLGLYPLLSLHSASRRITLHVLAFLAGLIFSLAHGGWIILPVAQMFIVMGMWVFDRRIQPPSDGRDKSRPYVPALTVLGILTGLLLHPNRANLLPFFKVQVLQVALATPTNIHLGLEWGHVEPFAFLANIGPLLIGAFLILLGLVLAPRQPLDIDRARTSVGLGVLVAALFAFTLKNGRMVEYFIPAATLWLATLWSLIDDRALLQHIKTQLCLLQPTRPRLGFSLVVTMLTVLIVRDVQGTYTALRSNAYPFHRFEAIAATLKANATPGARIFHDRWDAFGELFFHAPEFRYISGVDPTFLLATRPDLALAYDQTAMEISKPVTPNLETAIMVFQRTGECRGPSKMTLQKIERTIICK